ncbi:LysR family transcriptional regulator [Paenibacillus elgii]|uniref:LysR family transcriptional regulator n=1 Tax=Paenibacillus elgii TaxID=189691 RepID=A0A165QR34_9BACL|nr:LysR family transcriptional regulator [Paenibacillus elgii]KZE76122.1 LysR family transcriptional regulator [Paenibacillus elgii]
MTIARFKVLAKVIELGSFTKASEELNMTQSAVSHAIASLEAEWGATLLIRDRKKELVLTEVGQKTLIHIREILNRTERIQQELALAASLEAGTVRIGTFYSASSCLLPKILAKFQKKHPQIEFRFYEGTYEEMAEWLDTGVIDIGFVVQQDKHTKWDTVPLIQDKMVVAFPAGHKFQQREMITVEDLQDEPFIMPKGMYQSHIEEIFQQAKVKPSIRFEVQDCSTIANMVQEGLGITIGPELFLKTQQNLQIRSLNVSDWRNVALACPSVSDASPAVRAFLTVAQSVFVNDK